MTQLVLGIAGAVVGGMIGGPSGAAIGWSIGAGIGAAIDPPKGPDAVGPRLNDLKVQNSAYGQPIGRLKGTARLAGTIIWATNLIETRNEEEVGGKGGGGGATSTTFTYAANFAISFCGHQVCGITKLWANGKLIYDVSPENAAAGGHTGDSFNIRIYNGTEDQLPDSLIESHVGVGNTPAYRGQCYVVFEDLQLEAYGNAIPSITAEVVSSSASALFPNLIQDGTNIHTSDVVYIQSLDELWVLSNYSNAIRRYNYDGKYFISGIGSNLNGISLLNDEIGGYVWSFTSSSLIRYKTSDLSELSYSLSGITSAWIVASGDLWVNISGQIKKINKTSGLVDITIPSTYTVWDLTTDSSGLIWYTTGIDSTLHSLTTAGTDTTYLPGFSGVANMIIYDNDRGFLWVGDGNYIGNIHKINTSGVIIKTLAASPSGPLINPRLVIDYSSDKLYVSNNKLYGTSSGYDQIIIIDLNSSNIISSLITNDILHGNGSTGDYVQNVAPIVGKDTFAWVQGYYSDLYYSINTCQSEDQSIADIITEEVALVGLSPSDIDVSSITTGVRGYVIGKRTSVRAILEPLAHAFSFDVTESDWVLKFVPRGTSSVRSILSDDLACYDESSSEPPAEIASKRQHDLDLPSRVDVNYMRRESDYQTGNQFARRETVLSDNAVSLEWPMVLSDDQALHAAQTQMAESWMMRQSGVFTTTRKHIDLDPCDIVTIPFGEESRLIRIDRKDESRNGLVQFEFKLYDPSIYAGFGTAGGGLDSTQLGADVIANTNGELLDLPALLDSDSDAGKYWATSPVNQDDDWFGATLFKSLDNGVSYSQKESQGGNAAMGAATSLLATGRSDIFDESSSVTVLLTSGSLSSTTREAVLNGANACAIKSGSGWEVLQFMNATLIAANTYTLTGLLRGRKGTESFMQGHLTGDLFVMLSGVGFVRVSGEIAEKDLQRIYKHVSVGKFLVDATAYPFTNTCRALKPYAPVQLSGGRDSTGTVSIAWRRRTRLGGELLDGADVQLAEESERYDIEIWNSSYTILKRTVTGLTSASYTYSATDQTTDFGSTQSIIYVRVYQKSALVGRGTRLEGNI